MMQAVYFDQYGDIDVLKVGPKPLPQCGPQDVIVHMAAAGLNPVDFKIRRGDFAKLWPMALPIITGWDVAGTISEIGSDVTSFAVGDEVYAYNRPAFDDAARRDQEALIGVDGCCAEYVKVASWKLAKKPQNMTMAAAAAVPLAGLTAHQGLFAEGALQAQQSVLILNASGGVGSYAVQFAANIGAKVVGTCSSKNVDYVQSLGADAVVDYTLNHVVEDVRKVAGFEQGADLVFDCIGGKDTLTGLSLLKPNGMIVSIADFEVEAKAKEQLKNGKAFLVNVSGDRLKEITALIEADKVKAPSLEQFALADAVKAFEHIELGRTRGKVVLTN